MVVPDRIVRAVRDALDETGIVVIGESHGVHETLAVVLALAEAADARGIAFEWSYEELDAVLRRVVDDGLLNLDALWALPSTAEAFGGDGRIAAGHFAVLRRLSELGRLGQAIAFDRLDHEPLAAPHERDEELAERLLAEWDGRTRLLVLTGAAHATTDDLAGGTMATALRRGLPRLQTAMIDYAQGAGWFRGQTYDLPVDMPEAEIRIVVPVGSPAVVPGHPATKSCD